MASKDTITVGIAGLTGKFARLVASFLLDKSHVQLRGFIRNPQKLPSSLSSDPRVSTVQGGAFDAAAAREFVRGCDVVVCTYLGPDDLMTEGQKILVDACEAEGVTRYLASDFTLDFTKLEKGQLFPKDPMAEVKRYLDAKHKVHGVHVLIAAFTDTFFSAYFNVWDSENKRLQTWGGEDRVWELTSYRNAAEYTAAVALDEKAVGVQKFLGDRKTVHQIADDIHKVYGIKPQVENLGSFDELYERMHGLKQQYPQDIFKYLAMFYQYYCINGQCYIGEDSKLDNGKYPEIRPETVEDFLKRTPMELLPEAMNIAGESK